MKRMLLCLFFATATCLHVHAETKQVLHATLAVDKDTKPTTSFSPDVAKIYAFYIGDAIKKGDKLRAIWIAQDVGDAAPKGTKIDEATQTMEQDNPSGAFSLSMPAKGWPLGKYVVELYDNEKLAQTLQFTISEQSDDNADGDDAPDD